MRARRCPRLKSTPPQRPVNDPEEFARVNMLPESWREHIRTFPIAAVILGAGVGVWLGMRKGDEIIAAGTALITSAAMQNVTNVMHGATSGGKATSSFLLRSGRALRTMTRNGEASLPLGNADQRNYRLASLATRSIARISTNILRCRAMGPADHAKKRRSIRLGSYNHVTTEIRIHRC